MHTPVDVVEVRVWGRRAGAVALDPNSGYYAFEYEPAFARSDIELAPLAMPLDATREPVVFPHLPEVTFMRLPALLADALPDAFGNSLIDAWMANHGVEPSEITPLDRLAYMGRRAMGALEFRPERGPAKAKTTALELAQLVEGAKRAVRGHLRTDDETMVALAQILQVGTSAGGARAKAAIAWNPRTHEIRAGQFDVEPGFEHWLLKFDGMGTDRELGARGEYGRIEYAYHLMAAAAGLTVSPSRLLTEHRRAHFMTKRFDREGNTKHHLQTLCAMAHLDYQQKATHDVSQLLLTITRLAIGYDALEEAFRRVAFNVMAANCDDHTKNIAFLLRQGGAWELAPAYDVTYAYNPKGEWTFQHLMSVNGKFAGIERDDFMVVADRFGIGTAPGVLTRVAEAVAAWPEFAKKAGIGAAHARRIRGHHRSLA